MSSSLEERCKATRLCLASIIPLVRAFSRSSSHSFVSTLTLQRCNLMQACVQLEDIHPSLYDVQHCWDCCSGGPTAASRALAAEHLLFISTFTTFVDVLLVKLDRAAWAHAGSMENGGFRVLWGLLFDACLVFNLFPELWPVDHLPQSLPLYQALQALLCFLLPLTCPVSNPWAPPLGRPVTGNETHVMITPAWCAFINAHSSQTSSLPSTVRSLPLHFTATLCYIACEGLDPALCSGEAVNRFFQGLAEHAAARSAVCLALDMDAELDAMITPAVLEVAKRGFVLLQDPDQHHLQELLVTIFRHYELRGASGGAQPLFQQRQHQGGRPWSQREAMVPQVTTSEGELLRALCRRTPADMSQMEMDCMLMLAVSQSWPGADGSSTPSGIPSENIRCVMHVARHCSRFVAGWLSEMQSQRQAVRRLTQGGSMQSAFKQGTLCPELAMKYQAAMSVVQRTFRILCMHSIMHQQPGE